MLATERCQSQTWRDSSSNGHACVPYTAFPTAHFARSTLPLHWKILWPIHKHFIVFVKHFLLEIPSLCCHNQVIQTKNVAKNNESVHHVAWCQCVSCSIAWLNMFALFLFSQCAQFLTEGAPIPKKSKDWALSCLKQECFAKPSNMRIWSCCASKRGIRSTGGVLLQRCGLHAQATKTSLVNKVTACKELD